MNEPKWTKGPWRWEFIGTLGNYHLVGANGELVGNTPMDKTLQAAAPELYEHLDAMLAPFSDMDEVALTFDAAERLGPMNAQAFVARIMAARRTLSRARGEA